MQYVSDRVLALFALSAVTAAVAVISSSPVVSLCLVWGGGGLMCRALREIELRLAGSNSVGSLSAD